MGTRPITIVDTIVTIVDHHRGQPGLSRSQFAVSGRSALRPPPRKGTSRVFPRTWNLEWRDLATKHARPRRMRTPVAALRPPKIACLQPRSHNFRQNRLNPPSHLQGFPQNRRPLACYQCGRRKVERKLPNRSHD